MRTGGLPIRTARLPIPVTQTLGDYRLRIGSADTGLGSDPTAADPCYTGTYACFQDYTLRVLEAPSCLAPTNLAVNYTGGLTAEVTWVGEAETYNIDVNGEVTEGVTTPYTLEGLELATTYEVKVQANCGDNGTSEWTNAVSFATDLCMPENQCEITFELTDSYGDGWNGAYIEVLDVATGTSLAQMSNNNIAKTSESEKADGKKAAGTKATETETYTLAVCNGSEIQFVWHSGSFDGECSYVVYDVNGEEIFYGSGAMSEPVNYTMDCTLTCKVPTDLDASEIDAHNAELSWTENGEATEWVVAYSTDGENFVEEYATYNPFILTDLEAETEYFVKVRPDCDVDDLWSETVTFVTTEVTTITNTCTLAEGWNWISFNIDITLDDLKNALVAALPGTEIIINSLTQNTTFKRGRWMGQLNALDLGQMYMIKVSADCEIVLEGMPVDPAEHPVIINSGDNWIGYPFSETMSVSNAFAGFAVNGDMVMSQTASAVYRDGMWRGTLTTLEPGQGYIYSSAASEDRTLVFPTDVGGSSQGDDNGNESHWPEFNYHAYQFNKPLVAAIAIDGEIVTAETPNWDALEINFFIGDECRGNSNFLYNGYVEEYGDPFPIINGAPIYYNGNGDDLVTVKMYDHSNGIEYDECTVTHWGEPIEIFEGVENIQGWFDPESSIMLNFTTSNIEDLELANDDSLMEEGEKNTALISDAAGETVNVTLDGRTLWKDNSWNTLCLPFSLTADEVNDILAPGELKELDTENEYEGHVTGLEGTTLYLFFKDAENGIVAGVPYIIKWDGDGTDNIAPPVFNNVTIADNYYSPEDIAYALVEAAAKFDGGMFVGNFSSISFKTETKSVLFLGDANTLYYPQPVLTDPSEEYDEVTNPYVPVTIGAFRAYFQLADGSKVRSFRMNLGGNGGEATGILSTENGQLGMENDSWYSVDGRKLLNAPKRKGLYIHNGVKVVIK